MKIKHLSINANMPEKSARILAELSAGEAKPFPSASMKGAWLCVWSESENELIEFIPRDYALKFGEHAAIYEKQPQTQNFNAVHVMLVANQSLAELIQIADKYGLTHRFRARFGGPLYEIWLEAELLVEFCSDEISRYTCSSK